MAWGSHLATADAAVIQILGGPVLYASGAGTSVEVRGIFDRAYVLAESGQTGVSTTRPAVFLRLADLPSDPEDDDAASVTVDGVTYRVREAQKDGQGGVLLLLHVRD